MVSESILDLNVEVCSVWPIDGVCSFSPIIPWDATRTLCLHEGVCHISHWIWEKVPRTI